MIDTFYRALYRVAARLRDARNFVLRPRVAGAAVLVRVNADLLIIRMSYRPWYCVPCGAMLRGEEPRFTAARELQEEVGIAVNADALRGLGEFVVSHTWTEDHVYAFELRLETYPELHIDGREVVWAGFRPEAQVSNLPVWPVLPVLLARRY